MVVTQALKNYFVYILQCKDNSYYVGMSEDLSRRIQEHSSGYGSPSTSIRGFGNLVYYETFASKSKALSREKQIKGWSRQKKQALMDKNLSKLKTLAISRQSPRYLK